MPRMRRLERRRGRGAKARAAARGDSRGHEARFVELGSVSELAVLQAEQRLLGAQLASAAARFELERAAVELAHSVGQKVDSQPQE